MFRWLMYSLSGPCVLLFLLSFNVSWTRVVVSAMLYPCILCVALLMDLFVLCVACLRIVWENNLQYVWVGCHFVVVCYGSVKCGCRCSVG